MQSSKGRPMGGPPLLFHQCRSACANLKNWLRRERAYWYADEYRAPRNQDRTVDSIKDKDVLEYDRRALRDAF